METGRPGGCLNPGFVKPYPAFDCPTLDGQNWVFLGPLWYLSKSGDIYCIPAGTTTDGPSIPARLLCIVSPFGPIWAPSTLHDSGFRGTLLIWKDGRLIPANHDMTMLDNLFDEAMQVCGLDDACRRAVFGSVGRFGKPSYLGDIAEAIPNIVVPKGLPDAFKSQY